MSLCICRLPGSAVFCSALLSCAEQRFLQFKLTLYITEVCRRIYTEKILRAEKTASTVKERYTTLRKNEKGGGGRYTAVTISRGNCEFV